MESIWKQTAKKPVFPDQMSRQEADAVIIGGGMAGILTAWYLKKQGIRAVVLEAGVAGGGQTGNTTAKVTSQHGLIYDRLLQTMGEKKAWQYAKANEQAIQDYRELISELNIECGWKECPAYIYSEDDPVKLQKEAETAGSLGIEASYVKEIELPVKNAGVVCFQGQAQFHPLQLLYAVADEITVYEHVKVLKLDGNKVITNKGEIKAKRIIFTSHYPFLIRPGYYFARMHQERSYVAAVEGAQELHGMYLGAEDGTLSFRSYDNFLLLGGGGHRTGENPAGGQYEMLRERAKKYWPGCSVKTCWSAQDCMTLDGVPYIGQFSQETPDWYVATGFGKWGMTSSMVSARMISDAVLHRENPYKDVFSPHRFTPAASMKNFVKDGTHAAKDLSRRVFTPAKAKLEEIARGHGGIVDYHGEKVGVYKDDSGTVHMVSVKCPHLGCQLEWDAEEKSWDCPCHGSRFHYDGKLIDDPANTDLEAGILTEG